MLLRSLTFGVALALTGCGGDKISDTGMQDIPDAGEEAGVDAGPDASMPKGPATLLFSGDGEAFYDDAWAWDGASWTELSVAKGPSGREQHAMSQLGKKVVLFGGLEDPAMKDLADNGDAVWALGELGGELPTGDPDPEVRAEITWATETAATRRSPPPP